MALGLPRPAGRPASGIERRPRVERGASGELGARRPPAIGSRFVQQCLRITADGQFGPQTEAAVIAFQQRSGLDGRRAGRPEDLGQAARRRRPRPTGPTLRLGSQRRGRAVVAAAPRDHGRRRLRPGRPTVPSRRSRRPNGLTGRRRRGPEDLGRPRRLSRRRAEPMARRALLIGEPDLRAGRGATPTSTLMRDGAAATAASTRRRTDRRRRHARRHRRRLRAAARGDRAGRRRRRVLLGPRRPRGPAGRRRPAGRAGRPAYFQFIVPFDIDESEAGRLPRPAVRGADGRSSAVSPTPSAGRGAAPNVTTILDCCHSGYLARDTDLVPKFDRPRTEDVPDDGDPGAGRAAGEPGGGCRPTRTPCGWSPARRSNRRSSAAERSRRTPRRAHRRPRHRARRSRRPRRVVDGRRRCGPAARCRRSSRTSARTSRARRTACCSRRNGIARATRPRWPGTTARSVIEAAARARHRRRGRVRAARPRRRRGRRGDRPIHRRRERHARRHARRWGRRTARRRAGGRPAPDAGDTSDRRRGR